MSNTLDIAGDWIIFDNEETILYTSKVSQATFTVLNVLKRAVDKTYVEGRHFRDVDMHSEAVVFSLWVQNLPLGFEPIIGDKFSDTEAVTWIVHAVGINTLHTRFKLTCLEAK